MSTDAVPRRFPRSSPYWPVVTHERLRRVLPGLGVSALGDGMALVAVTWLALQLAPGRHHGVWVAIAVAAYSLPSAAGAVLFGRFLAGRGGAQLAGWDAILRAGALAAIPVAYALGALSIELYVVLLAVSSLLHSWGSAGRYTLIAELLPQPHHLPANALLTTITEVATIIGPPLAGLLIGWSGAATVIAVDAATFAVLAVTYRLALPRVGRADPIESGASGSAGFGVIRRDRTLLGLLALTFGFFFLFGPVLVALPVHVTQDLHGSATALSVYYTAFGIGAATGGLAAGHLRRWSLWPTIVGVVLGFGAAMLPLGLAAPTPLALVAFAIAGLTSGPYTATSLALFQRTTTTALLPQVLAANGAVTILAVPLGTMLGGPLVSVLGARQTLLFSAITILALGLLAACLAAVRRRRGPRHDD
jgi:predicted MFS family arabinose efflux permease